MSSTSPTKPRTGAVISASVTSSPLITNPPDTMRLCATNWRSSSAMAGPDQATHPSASRKRR
ncbi:Uncharacterised protein [Mycobacteroides abscessus subsp. abscessus]|nr:Uncharacterised protein [Mycobacteroides abscessus subsp. abscessus]